jgi:hypothetical protein
MTWGPIQDNPDPTVWGIHKPLPIGSSKMPASFETAAHYRTVHPSTANIAMARNTLQVVLPPI